ncbi:hypothetical protein WA026_003839 [Henosepilachna vigintioctopunctata]|uniref:Uncharacterized protein n=1 Tax=Henosepilachna vigintioctopunctata TaxID=420089 RepID=A0AAW1UD14_9CUCU
MNKNSSTLTSVCASTTIQVMPDDLTTFNEPLSNSSSSFENNFLFFDDYDSSSSDISLFEEEDKYLNLKLFDNKIGLLHNSEFSTSPIWPKFFSKETKSPFCDGTTQTRKLQDSSKNQNINKNPFMEMLPLKEQCSLLDSENEVKQPILRTSSSVIFPKEYERSSLFDNQGRTLFWTMSLEHVDKNKDISKPPTLPVKQRRSSEYLQESDRSKHRPLSNVTNRCEAEYEILRKLPPIPILPNFADLEKSNSTENESYNQPVNAIKLNPPALPPRPRSREKIKIKKQNEPLFTERYTSNLDECFRNSTEVSKNVLIENKLKTTNELRVKPVVPPRQSKVSSAEHFCNQKSDSNNEKDVNETIAAECLETNSQIQNNSNYPSRHVRHELVKKKLTPQMTEQITEALIQSVDRHNLFKYIMGNTFIDLYVYKLRRCRSE